MTKLILTYIFVTLTYFFIITTTFAQSSKLPSVFLEELTWTEVQEALDTGIKTIIIPTGGTEQNGPHMVLGKHNFRVKFLAEKIANQLGDALVAPTLSYVPEGEINDPNSHMAFAGTIHLPEEYFIKVLEYAARSFKKHGFTDIVLVGDSGPNQNGMKVISEQLNQEWQASNTRVHFISKFILSSQSPENRPLIDSLIKKGIPQEAFGMNKDKLHADIYDASLLLAVNPKLVRIDKMKKLGNDPEENRKLGISGDPRKASAKIGKKFIKIRIQTSVNQILTLKKENR